MRPREPTSPRARAASALVILMSLAIVSAVLGAWAHRTVFDTTRFVSVAAPLADQPKIRQALAGYLTDRAFEALDLEDRIDDALAELDRLGERSDLLAGAVAALSLAGLNLASVLLIGALTVLLLVAVGAAERRGAGPP
jgi:hypothetical protein